MNVVLLQHLAWFFETSLQVFVFKAFSLELMTSNMHKEPLAENAIIASHM